jgi:hypothetical protein
MFFSLWSSPGCVSGCLIAPIPRLLHEPQSRPPTREFWTSIEAGDPGKHDRVFALGESIRARLWSEIVGSTPGIESGEPSRAIDSWR